MANKILSAFCIIIILLACNQSKKNNTADEEGVTDTAKKVCSINPNGDSELAKLMRSMYSQLSSVRQNAIDGKLSGGYPSFIKSIYSATPTDSTMVDEEFPARAKEFVTALDDMYHRYPESQHVAYDIVVSKCESCHMHYCPGPLGKIRKLYIKQ